MLTPTRLTENSNSCIDHLVPCFSGEMSLPFLRNQLMWIVSWRSRHRFSVVYQISKSNLFPTLEEYGIAYLERV